MSRSSSSEYRQSFSDAVQVAGRLAHASIPAIALIALLSAVASAQLPVPVDTRMPTPGSFDFYGTWKCQGGYDSATLEVGTHRHGWNRSRRHTDRDYLRWTLLTEKGSDFTGHYWVAYDRDKKQFVTIDVDDPAYAAYKIDQWDNNRLVLNSFTAAQQLGWNIRWVYELHGGDEFKVSFESKDGITWGTQSTCLCQRIPIRPN